jgi:serpin B
MKTLRALACLSAALVISSCGNGATGPDRITALPRALTPQEQSLIAADNRFAIKLLREAAADTRDALPNLFVSPLSVAMALGMTYNGAAGTTEAAMRTTLELDGMSIAEVNQAYRDLIQLLRNLDPGVRFQIANSIWYRESFTVEQPFLDANRSFYDARVEALDFAAPSASVTINDWVSQQTQGLITEIVDDVLPSDAMMYLINAIYFKGNWTEQFSRELTTPRPFHLAEGSTVNVPTMTHGKRADVRVFADGAVEVAELPYGGRAFAMTLVVPREAASIDELVEQLTLDQWNGWTAELDSTSLEIYLPKFKLENDLSLKTVLTALGMGIAFDCVPPEMADFTLMHVPQEACITSVKHRTYVDVNEEGTEAAAVTSVEVGVTSAPPTIVVDRPFIFALRENLSGTILFMGVIRNPAAE